MTTFLFTSGAWLAFRNTEAEDVGRRPWMRSDDVTGRILEAARRRLGVD